jgi:hypothetical protein
MGLERRHACDWPFVIEMRSAPLDLFLHLGTTAVHESTQMTQDRPSKGCRGRNVSVNFQILLGHQLQEGKF